MAVIDSAEDFRMGRVVSRLFEALFANAATFLALAALLSIPSLVLSLYLTSDITQSMGLTPAGTLVPGRMGHFFLITASSTLVYVVFGFLLQAAITQGTVSWLSGEAFSIGKSLSVAVKNVMPLVVIAILATLGIGFGFALLIVPGIILVLMWSVVAPVRVTEGTGITESFGRSRALTKGYRGRIFLLFLGYFVVASIAGMVLALLVAGTMLPKPGNLSAVYLALSWILRVVLSSITAAGAASIYYELRLVKEGIGAQQMAAAFD
jgi:hypothetical protein